MKALMRHGAASARSLLPWRLQSWNNLLLAAPNALFAGVRRTPPQPVSPMAPLELHALLCHRDVNMMLVSAKSLLRHLDAAALLLHDDGSLTGADCALLHAHLPGVRIVGRREADDEMRRVLPADAFGERQRRIFLLKLFDFNHFSRGGRTVLLDADIIFLSRPDEIVAWIADAAAPPFYNLDRMPSYRAGRVPDGLAIPPRLNAGFMGYRGRFDMAAIVQRCREVDYWLEDQTIYALLLAPHGARPLPAERYKVYTGGELPPNAAMVHFISSNRFEGLRYPKLARRLFGELRRR